MSGAWCDGGYPVPLLVLTGRGWGQGWDRGCPVPVLVLAGGVGDGYLVLVLARLPSSHLALPSVDRQTPVKTVPSPILRMLATKLYQFTVKHPLQENLYIPHYLRSAVLMDKE